MAFEDDEDEGQGPRLVNVRMVRPDRDARVNRVLVPDGEIRIYPEITLRAGKVYGVQVWDDDTISIWELIMDGIKAEIQ